MTPSELIEHTVRITLEQMGYKPRNTKQYISQSEALRLLKPVRIGRNRLKKMVAANELKAFKTDLESRTSGVKYDRKEIYKLLNK